MILPKQWHIYVVDLEPGVGTKPGKHRPCLCIQPSEFCLSGLGSSLIIPLTTNIQKEDAFPLRIRIPKGTCGLNKDSDALVEQILAWDLRLFRSDLGEIPEGLQDLFKSAIKDFLDL